ncbi:MAG TPA: ATP-binding protein [Longimicrobiales bacterium]|nr:ATP-binding protein [Longimicrobiales bacterium]
MTVDLRDEVERLQQELHQVRAEAAAEHAELINATKLATLGSFVAGIAHELNTPMGALNSNHDVLRRALDRLQNILADEVVEPHELDEVRRVVRALDGVMKVNDLAVERMQQLVMSLRSFGRPDRSERAEIDLHESIECTLAILGHQLRGRVDIVRDYQDLPPVDCYPNQLNQVFMNLLVNAGQAIPDRGTITIRTRQHGAQVSIEVEDTGVGIAPQNLERIFEPGFTTKGNRIGMGMGMLIVRQIIERHAGEISIQSEPGVGTVVQVVIPARIQEPTIR